MTIFDLAAKITDVGNSSYVCHFAREVWAFKKQPVLLTEGIVVLICLWYIVTLFLLAEDVDLEMTLGTRIRNMLGLNLG
jgi:hypothetical protein